MNEIEKVANIQPKKVFKIINMFKLLLDFSIKSDRIFFRTVTTTCMVLDFIPAILFCNLNLINNRKSPYYVNP